jgi:tRNA 2-thiocytidine biosynthesis protein TtcA
MFRALMNARPSHLLDPKLFDFAGLALGSVKFEADSDLPPKLR